MKKFLSLFLFATFFISGLIAKTSIDRKALVMRNNPHITAFDSLTSFSVGNGEFAFTADITGLQTFPDDYKKGIPLGTQSQWGWHSFANPENFKHEETLKSYNFRGKEELYAVQFNDDGRQKDAANWFRENPHRLHLGIIGFDIPDKNEISSVDQTLDLWQGIIFSSFIFQNNKIDVRTTCHPKQDMIAASIHGNKIPALKLNFPYPSGAHTDDGCDWTKNELHSTEIIENQSGRVVLKRIIDDTVYYLTINWQGQGDFSQKASNMFLLQPSSSDFAFTVAFTAAKPENSAVETASDVINESAVCWMNFWKTGAVVDFSACKDSRARELERRVVLSQYLLAIQCAGSTPPQETGLTYNSWYGKFHLEMIWWHQSHFATWNHPEMLEKTLNWYFQSLPVAKEIAARQGFKGARWMKMTDPSGTEAPSKVGSFLIWQQPHLIYLAELVYRANPSKELLKKYAPLIDETAKFMFSFADYELMEGRYVLKGAIPAQETLRASETVNPPFELAYWHFAMSVAQKWRERLGQKRNLEWDEMIDKLSPLASQDKLYLAAETALDTYKDIRFTSDHMAVLGALGIVPKCPLVRPDYMKNTLDWIWDNWNWGKTWGWDYPMTAMNATRLGDPEKAVGALLMDKRTNTYLPNGHNYQDSRLRVYLPGNGGLLTAVGLMCAGWDGCKVKNPGFPKNGKWKVKWEGLKAMP
jgi:hypothetical protein